MPRPEASRVWRFATIALVALLATGGTASAHRLKVFASAIGNSIEGQAYFVGSGPAAGVDVTLRDAANTLLQSGKTGPDGKFALPTSGTGDVVVTVDAEDGHIAHFTIAGSELDPVSAPDAAAKPAAAPAEKKPAAAAKPKPIAAGDKPVPKPAKPNGTAKPKGETKPAG